MIEGYDGPLSEAFSPLSVTLRLRDAVDVIKVPAGALRTTLALVLIGSGLGCSRRPGPASRAVALTAFPVAVAALVIAVMVREARCQTGGERARRRARLAHAGGEPGSGVRGHRERTCCA